MQLKFNDFDFRSKCSISCALEIVGDKWTLLIIRDALFKGSQSFGDFRSLHEKIASNILSDRLEKLVKFGILDKKQNPHNKLKYDYCLTQRGRELETVLLALGKWGYENVDESVDVKNYVNQFQPVKKR